MMSLIFLDNFQNTRDPRKINLQLRPYFGLWFDLCFTASDPMRASAGVFNAIAFKPLKAWPLIVFGEPVLPARTRPRQKVIVMPEQTSHQHLALDCERYRAYIAPLNLSKEQEDELLRDLWAITQTLVDQSFISPTYPQQFAIAAQAFRALDDAVAVESNQAQQNQETPKPQEEL